MAQIEPATIEYQFLFLFENFRTLVIAALDAETTLVSYNFV